MHGPLLITIAPNQPLEIKQIGMSPVRYENIAIDVTGVVSEEDLRNKVISDLKVDSESMITELEEVLSLVYSITLVGKNSRQREIESWKKTIVEHTARLEATGTAISVRRVEAQISPEVTNLKQLAQQSSPAGILANTILAIEEGRDDPFLNELIKEWILKIETANRAGVYSSLPPESILEATSDAACSAIKDECNRLLGELMNQISNPN